MNTAIEAKKQINPDVTPVWFLCDDGEGAEIFHTTFKDPRALMILSGGRWSSRSCWYETEAEFREKQGIIDKCLCCGSPFATLNWCKPYPELLAERQLCFTCNHWIHTTIPKRDLPGTAIVGGTFYSFDHERPMATGREDFLGHAGHKFTIRFNDGRTVETNNLWNGGKIPTRFLAQLPDNATFD